MTQLERVLGIAYELKTLWGFLTRKELSEYYGVSERTLYTYSKMLQLPKKNDRNHIVQKQKGLSSLPVEIHVKNPQTNIYEKKVFPDWGHFALWTKAQSHSIVLNSVKGNSNTKITCSFSEEKEPARKYREALTKLLT